MIFSQQAQTTRSLDEYLDAIAKRLRASIATRGMGILSLTALLGTCLCVFLTNRFAFSAASILSSRTLLVAALASVVVLLLVRPLRRLARGGAFQRAADEAERCSPEFDGRLRTWADENARAASRGHAPSPLLALLAQDTQQAAAVVPLGMVVSRGRAIAFAAAGCAGILALLWLSTSGPDYWRYGTAKLWAGWFLTQEGPLYELQVEPGDTTIRQGGRLDVTAVPIGFEPATMEIYAKFESSVDWERAPMRPQLQGFGFDFTFSLVREPLRYYVEAGRLRSREFQVGVVAMPTVENIRLEYQYPSWSGLQPSIEDPGGDITAVRGTRVSAILTTDKKLEGGLLVVGQEEVAVGGNRATIEVQEDSSYYIAALYRGERVRLTEDYFITEVPDRKPEVRILEPGRDWRATSIEEVGIRLEASDDFGLRDFELRYTVNGIAEDRVALPLRRGAKQLSGEHWFYLEEMGAPGGVGTLPAAGEASSLPPPAPEAGLLPGDLISYYMVASDAKREVRSDMYFITVQPFQRRFSQSQQAGGRGGGQRQDEISRRQREIVLATWNLIKERDAEDGRAADKLRESATMLSQLQATLMQQAQTLVQRTRARQLTDRNPKFAQFAEFLEQAAGFMQPAAEALEDFRLEDAVAPEQQALQYLLRAEAIFTDIQISMGRNGRGGGASRDLAEMFELEMDLEKNQYETGSGASGQQMEQEVDEALKKLEELARRQERLAERGRDREQASFEQRWQQEMLRREAEDLKRRLEQLQRRQQGQQRADGQSRGGAQRQGAAQGGSGSSQQMDRAIQQLERAAREMERGSRGRDAGASSDRALQELRRALAALAQQRQAGTQAAVANMAQEAAELVEEQHRAAAELQESLKVALEAYKAQGGRPTGQLPTGMTREEEIDLATRKREIGERLAEIEKGMQRHARQLRNQNEWAARALTNALLELQQSDAALTIQYAVDLILRGMAPYAASNEGNVSRALRRLRNSLREIGQFAQQDGDTEEQGLDRLLSEVERLRRGLEEAARPGEQERGQQSNGQQPGGRQGAPGEAGKRGSARAGDRGQSNSISGLGGSDEEWRGGWNRFGTVGDGGWRRRLPPVGGDRLTRERMERALESGAAEVPRLAQRMRSTSRDFDPQEIAELRRFAQSLGDGRFLGNPALLEQEYHKMLSLLEQLEVRLRRQVELDDKEEVRAIVSEPVPEPYREAVAEYYRKLGGSQ